MEKDALLTFLPSGIRVTEKGKPFVRNICMAFDVRLKRKLPATSLFSMTV
jgi:oxygen-independent coproporphyrinogen-3 oxidase